MHSAEEIKHSSQINLTSRIETKSALHAGQTSEGIAKFIKIHTCICYNRASHLSPVLI